MKALGSGSLGDGIRALSSGVKAFSDLHADSNSEYLLSIVIPEVQRLYGRFDELEERHQQYLNTDWLTLLADADHKARSARGRDRVRRIGAILCDSAWKPGQPSYETEELMRVAMNLADLDAKVLGELVAQQTPFFDRDSGRARFDDVNRYWAGADRDGYQQRNRMPALTMGISEGDLQTACARLQSFGLVVQIDRSSTFGVLGLPPFSILLQGIKFIESVKLLTAAEA
jgi:predicted metalloendopeptidase